MTHETATTDGWETRETVEQTIQAILRETNTIAVVGLSANPSRDSYGVAAYMKAQGFRIIPVNPKEREVLGETSYPSLQDVPMSVDLVDVFRRSEFVPDIARQAIAIGAKALWLQLGVISPEGRRIAEKAGLRVVMDRCLMVEHRLRRV